jgi:hypothetical protein
MRPAPVETGHRRRLRPTSRGFGELLMSAPTSPTQAIQNAPEPGTELATMGDYHPNGEYLASPGDFEAWGCRRG